MRGERRLLRVGEYLIGRETALMPWWPAPRPAFRLLRSALGPAPRPRPASILQASASAGDVNSTAGYTALRFPRHKLGPAYRAAEVDEFVGRIEATLSGNARLGQAVTAADVQAAKFKVTRHGGYDQLPIDKVLDYYARELGQRPPPGP